MRLNTTKDIPSQESREKWFKSHLLGREVELAELYEMPQDSLAVSYTHLTLPTILLV